MIDIQLTEEQIKLLISLIRMDDLNGEDCEKLDEVATILLGYISPYKKG
jgi:hypothetical protein